MYCQFEQIKERNVHVKCFNQALYHVHSAKPKLQNYCALHIQRLPRNTKLELLFDVIELPPSEPLLNQLIPTTGINETENDISIRSSAGSIASKSDLIAASCSESEHDIPTIKNRHGEARAYKSKSSYERPFKNLGELCECYGYLPRPKTWRMLPYAIPGEIHALPNTRGFALATNGVHVAIENFEYKELFIGHLDYFVIDDLRAPAGSVNTLNQAAENTFKPVRNQLKQFDELFL